MSDASKTALKLAASGDKNYKKNNKNKSTKHGAKHENPKTTESK